MKRLLRILAALLLAAPLATADNLPDLGDVSRATLSPQQERAIGNAVMMSIRADRSYYDDPELTQYLNSLGYRLVAASADSSQSFEFFVIKDPTLNAFALPGGFIGVHTGLILAARNESELAGVLAHEIAHVTQHHIARMINRQEQAMLPTLAALAVAILAARSNPQVSQAAIATAQAVTVQNQLDFTREHEHEADRVGIQTLTKAGFDSRGMASFFERLQRSTRLYENNAPTYLRTHPLTSDRIADMENRVASLPYKQVPDSLAFQLMRAKLRAELPPPSQAVTEFETTLKEKRYASETAERYGYAYALYRKKDYARAWDELERLRRNQPVNAILETLAGDILLEEGRLDAAAELYKSALKRYPTYRGLIYGRIEALIRAKRFTEAKLVAEDRAKALPNDSALHSYLSQIHTALGNEFMRHRTLAEAYAVQGNLVAAIEQLQIALKSPGTTDFYQLSMAEARLKQLRAEDAETRQQRK